MSIEPLKKELESIDQELEAAMLRLAETTQRVDDLLADYTAGDGEDRKAPAMVSLRPAVDEPDEESGAGSGAGETPDTA
jgi:hypothetical protein